MSIGSLTEAFSKPPFFRISVVAKLDPPVIKSFVSFPNGDFVMENHI
jgi:hypothetical protein